MTEPKSTDPKPAATPAKTGALKGDALRHLRGLGHALGPVVMVGKDGVTDAVIAALRGAVLTHAGQVKVLSEAPLDRHEAAAQLAERTESTLVQVLGRTLLLYKRHPKKPKIELPGKAIKAPGAAKARRTKRKAKLKAKGRAVSAARAEDARNTRSARGRERAARSESDDE